MKWIIDPHPNGALTARYRISDPPRFYLSKAGEVYTLADGDRLVCSGTKAECEAMADGLLASQADSTAASR